MSRKKSFTYNKPKSSDDAIDDLKDDDDFAIHSDGVDVEKVFERVIKQPKLVAFVGYKGSGKDEAAKVLADNTKHIKMADCLKAMLTTFLCMSGVDDDVIHEMLEGKLKEVPTDTLQGKTPRWAMQSIGTEWGRHLIGESVWLDVVESQVRNSSVPVVLTDVRFKNEAAMVRKCGGYIIRIVRDGYGYDGHESESEIESLKVDAIIGNNASVDELYSQVRLVVGSMK